jgi:hypothetical protein
MRALRVFFPSEDELERHIQEYIRLAEVFRCDKCKALMTSQEELEKHVRELHSD